MLWNSNSDKLSTLQFYQEMGFSCSLIKGNDDMNSYKNPSLDLTNGLTEQDLEQYTSIGVHLGKNSEIRAIVIDGFGIKSTETSDSVDHRLRTFAKYNFVKKCMTLLGLPEDYEWLIKTPKGWHIIITAPSFGFKKAVYSAKKDLQNNAISGSVIRLRHIELLWEGHLVMPPSDFERFARYGFHNQKPQNIPLRVGAAQIFEFICYYCGEFRYITHLTDDTNFPIIGNAHLFPHYRLNWSPGSMYDEYGPNLDNLCDNEVFLNSCRNSLGFNMRGHMLVYNDLINNYKVKKELDTAIKCFRMANDDWGHYNLACLMAIGAMSGSTNEFYYHLEQANGFPNEYKDQLILLYLAKNYSYEKYAIIDIGFNEIKRIEKIAILSVDSQGNILDSKFLSSNSDMLENMFKALDNADYIAGCDLATIEEAIRHECEFYGDSFSYDATGSDSFRGKITKRFEGSYFDAFRRPWVDIAPITDYDNDPFCRIYKIKELIIKKLKDL